METQLKGFIFLDLWTGICMCFGAALFRFLLGPAYCKPLPAVRCNRRVNVDVSSLFTVSRALYTSFTPAHSKHSISLTLHRDLVVKCGFAGVLTSVFTVYIWINHLMALPWRQMAQKLPGTYMHSTDFIT
uniref:Secreted protein n=1 Tax=Heterorhabditis bacteriophora TaxID=37862 RepID=A0A1I7W893_HETBA